MKKFKSKRHRSFTSLLVKNYLFFTMILVFILFLILFLWIMISSHSIEYPLGDVSEQRNVLQAGDYHKINEKLIVGANGYIEVVDENNQVIFRKGKIDKEISSYTERELKFIPNVMGDEFYVQVSYFNDEKGEKLTLLIRYYFQDEIGQGETQGIEIIDSELNVIYSGGKIEELNTKYTPNELGYLMGTYAQNYTISKYSFLNKDGNEYYLICKIPRAQDSELLRMMSRDTKFILIVFIMIYCICIALFIFWLNRKVKKPLKKLNDAMGALAKGKSTELIVYEGTFEFSQICENFNVMVTRLNESEKERRYLESEKQKMIADISHDFKTPITTIQGYAKALSDGLISLDEQQKYLNIIHQKSAHLTDLINVFYEYSKLEHPQFELTLEHIDFSEFLRSYVAEKYEHIMDLGFEIEIEIPENKILTWIDKIQLQRAFDNILGNSLKHNPKGTKLKVALKECDHTIKIMLADNGIGIPSDIVYTIFEAFIVGDDSRHSKQGSGLGLAITKKIIEKHKGKIILISSLENEYKTSFEIVLPKN